MDGCAIGEIGEIEEIGKLPGSPSVKARSLNPPISNLATPPWFMDKVGPPCVLRASFATASINESEEDNIPLA